MMPTPFVLTDAVVIKKRIKPSPRLVEELPKIPMQKTFKKENAIIKVDSIKVK
ncbi:hypothetical protein [Flavobacterium acetivorans]|uniref:hypothetical protein n=1 Tax=Flavobacterium acetivorans TaxID=2893883 RepID=UPI001E297A82|nr:hypothetical protein [Flavobacterium sp. F-29]UFH36336.1 hypothetical protein LNP19_04650 [Flavobacterium sp. F-29]